MVLARSFICLLGVAIVFAAPNSRILDGDDATSGQFPSSVSVRRNNVHSCGGSIISVDHILTAGHCVSHIGTESYPVSQISVRVGSINQYSGGKIHDVKAIHIHPSYGNFMHDVAVITLAEPLEWTDKIKKIDLADVEETIEDNTEVIVNGWGLKSTGDSPFKLQHMKMHSISQSECEYQAGYGYDSILCLHHSENEGICNGDSGAGVITNNKLVGVINFAFGNCGTKYPDVSSKVSYYREWIESLED